MILNPKLNKTHLSNHEYLLYSRHLSLDGIGINGQKRLKHASILFVGAGGLASSAIIYLASSGIGSIGIIDNDHVTLSNLHRQILYNSYDMNELKVICAQNKIKMINPKCQVQIYPDKLNEKNAKNLIKQYDIILDTSDNFYTRYIIDSICYKLHKVHIYGAIQSFEGQISVFNYKSGIKYSDLYPEFLNLQSNKCSSLGVLGVLPGIIGLIQATEAIKIITGIGHVLNGYILIYNALTLEFKKRKIQPYRIQNHVLLTKYTKITESESNHLSIKDFQIKLLNNNNILIIDVRQNIEFQIKHIQHAINIPLKQIIHTKQILFIQKNASNKIIIIYCSDNSRSIIASKILNQYNICHYRLKDGIQNFLRKERDSNPC